MTNQPTTPSRTQLGELESDASGPASGAISVPRDRGVSTDAAPTSGIIYGTMSGGAGTADVSPASGVTHATCPIAPVQTTAASTPAQGTA